MDDLKVSAKCQVCAQVNPKHRAFDQDSQLKRLSSRWILGKHNLPRPRLVREGKHPRQILYIPFLGVPHPDWNHPHGSKQVPTGTSPLFVIVLETGSGSDKGIVSTAQTFQFIAEALGVNLKTWQKTSSTSQTFQLIAKALVIKQKPHCA